MTRKDARSTSRTYPIEVKQEAVQMLLDGLSAKPIADRLGPPGIRPFQRPTNVDMEEWEVHLR